MTTWIRRSRSPTTVGRSGAVSTSTTVPPDPSAPRRATPWPPPPSSTTSADVDRIVPPLHPAGFVFGEVQRVVDEAREPLALLDDDPQVVGRLAHRAVHLGVARRHGREHHLIQPLADEPRKADDRRQWRAQLVAHVRQERALRRRGGLAAVTRAAWLPRWRPRAQPSAGRRPGVRGPPSALPPPCTGGVLDGRSDEAADRVQEGAVARQTSRPERRLSTARMPTVRPFETSGVPRNDVASMTSRERPVAWIWILVDVAEHEGAVRPVELDELRRFQVEWQAQSLDLGRRGRAAADRSAVGQDALLLVGQEDEGPVEPQAARHGDERPIQQLGPVERAAGGRAELVEGHRALAIRCWRSTFASSDRRNSAFGHRACWSRSSDARRRAAPPYSTRLAGSRAARTIATESEPGPPATR